MSRRPYQKTADDLEAERSIAWMSTPGLYAGRLRRRAPEVAVKIAHGPTTDPDTGESLDRSWYWNIWVDGKHVVVADPSEPTMLAYDGLPWRLIRQIEQWEYDYLLQNANWARAHAPNAPEANPAKKVKLGEIDPIF